MRNWINLVMEDQALTEISRVPELSPGEESYESLSLWRQFNDYRPIPQGPLIGEYELWVGETDTGNLYAFAVEEHEGDFFPEGCLHLLTTGEANHYSVSMIFVDSDARGKGVGYALYKMMLMRGITIESDDLQTPGGQAIWNRLVQDRDIVVTARDTDGLIYQIHNLDELYDDGETDCFIARAR